MRFLTRKRRQAPSVIIISLIDVLMVVLIFLMVTTTVKQQAAVKLSLPESHQAKQAPGANQSTLIVTIPKQGPLYLGSQPVTLEKLKERLAEAAKKNPQLLVSLRADNDAPFGQIIKVMDVAKAANVKSVSAFMKSNLEAPSF